MVCGASDSVHRRYAQQHLFVLPLLPVLRKEAATIVDDRKLKVLAAVVDEYIKTGEPMDKAGSYAVQGIGSKFIEKIEGSYSNVVGLPIERVYEILKENELDKLNITISHTRCKRCENNCQLTINKFGSYVMMYAYIETNLEFDIVIKLASGKKYQATIDLDVPTNEIATLKKDYADEFVVMFQYEGEAKKIL